MGDFAGARMEALAALDATEKRDHMYRDTFRAIALASLGRTALEQHDVEAADAAFSQAALHLEGRPRTLGGGYLMVQALAGLARTRREDAKFLEALELIDNRKRLNFSYFWTCGDGPTQLDLARAAAAVGRTGDAAMLLERAVLSGSAEAATFAAAQK